MSIRGPKERKERALGVRLQLKASRSGSPKSAMIRKPYPPGMHGQNKRRKALSDFGIQLKEKRKCKVSYGIDERTLKAMFQRAFKMKGSTSTRLMELLESRLDNVVYRLGFGGSRGMARQLVTQGHIFVNGKRVRSPGYSVRPGDTVGIRPESAAKGPFRELRTALEKYEPPAWFQFDLDKLEGKMIGAPEESSLPFEVNALVESFSK